MRQHKNNRILKIVVTALLLAFGTGSAIAADKPNIVVIWGDDVGWFNISAYNNGMMG
jgi:arylsulfatase